MIEPNEITPPRVTLVYMYTESGKGGKPVYLWLGVADNQIRRYRGKNNKNIVLAKPGMVFTFPEENGSIHAHLWELVDQPYLDQKAVVMWAAKERAYTLQRKAKVKLAKALKEDRLLIHLEPLALAYASLPGVSREQFLAWCVSRIVRGVK